MKEFKKNKKGLLIAGVVFALICLIAITAIVIYMGKNKHVRTESSDEISTIEKDDIQSEYGSKVYRVISFEEMLDKDMDSIVYNLQRRANEYTTEAVVLKKKINSVWYIEISMPGVEDEVYQKVIQNPQLQFIGGYGTSSEEIIVSSKNITSATVAVLDSETGIKNYMVSMKFDDEGTEAFAEGTTKYIGDKISIVFDGELISEPNVTCAITSGDVQIAVQTYEEADRLASLLRIGYIGFELEEME